MKSQFLSKFTLFRLAGALLRPLCLLCVALPLVGCAMLGQESQVGAGGGSSAHKPSMLEFIAKSAPGAQAEFDDPFSGRVTVSVGDTYISALGETCRKATLMVAGKDGPPEFAVVCQDSGKNWIELPNLMVPEPKGLRRLGR